MEASSCGRFQSGPRRPRGRSTVHQYWMSAAPTTTGGSTRGRAVPFAGWSTTGLDAGMSVVSRDRTRSFDHGSTEPWYSTRT